MGDEDRRADARPETQAASPSTRPGGPIADRLEAARAAGQYGSIGLSFVFAIVIGVAVGAWLDRITGWSPLFIIVFFIAGFAAGVLNVYRALGKPRR